VVQHFLLLVVSAFSVTQIYTQFNFVIFFLQPIVPAQPKKSTGRRHYEYLVPSTFPREAQESVTSRDVWQGFKEYTTAHGVPHLDRARGGYFTARSVRYFLLLNRAGPVKKTFWTLVTVCMVAGLLYNLISISQLFFSYKVDVTISLLHVNELTFPAITICNMSPVKKSALEGNTRRRRKRSVGKLSTLICYWKEAYLVFTVDQMRHPRAAQDIQAILAAALAASLHLH
jgi:hypothetical protein